VGGLGVGGIGVGAWVGGGGGVFGAREKQTVSILIYKYQKIVPYGIRINTG
jgi:hypothetical protein